MCENLNCYRKNNNSQWIYCRLQLPVHTGNKSMFCLPIKIQSLDNQTSKFTRPLGNVLTPLHKDVKGVKVSNAYGHVVFYENQNKTEKLIEEFLSDIACDLWQYLGELRKKVFTSTLSARYLADLHFLSESTLKSKGLHKNMSPRRAETFRVSSTRKASKARKRASFLLRQAGVNYLAHVKGSSRKRSKKSDGLNVTKQTLKE